jgi:o-succinylbenzoate synthase
MSAAGDPASDRQTLSLQPYALPLRAPWRSARGTLRERRGWLVRASASGATGYGDCAPLPEAGTEQPADAERALALLAAEIAGLRIAEALAHPRLLAGGSPAACWAVECALIDLQARLDGLPFHHCLSAHAGLPAMGRPARVEVNAALGSLMDLRSDHLACALAAGYRVLKLKLGLGPPADEIARLQRLCLGLPGGVTLRLDANGAWDESGARAMIEGLADLPIESLEEPLGIPDPDALARLQGFAPFPIALDESLPRCLRSSTSMERLASTGLPVRRAILKPATIGGPRQALALARALIGQGAEIVVTSILDAAPGLWACAQLACLLPTDLAHGLGTAGWLARDLGPGPPIAGGRIQIPPTPGTGFEPGESPRRPA